MSSGGPFAQSAESFEDLLAFLESGETGGFEHAELEEAIEARGRELMRLLMQDHLDLRAEREIRLSSVVDAGGRPRPRLESGHCRSLETIFGEVRGTRLAYRELQMPNLQPADGVLNMPAERHSHGLRRLAAIESSRGSFDQAAEAIARTSGQWLGKRQVEELARRGTRDFEQYYSDRHHEPAQASDVLVISADGKGIVMRPDALRPATATAAGRATKKLATRLSKGEKANRKRMAVVGAVFDATPARRIPADILAAEHHVAKPGPVAKNKWLMASVVSEAAAVISQVFDEAERRDPEHARTWLALVDGNRHQIACIEAEARRRKLSVAIVCDFVHVLEYLWKAAWCFHKEGDPAAQDWVRRHATTILAGGATTVAGAIRRAATRARLDKARRTSADECAAYLTNKRRYLDYPRALGSGWPIATGVIEGAWPPPRARQDGSDGRPLGPGGRRGSAQAPRSAIERRLRGLLEVPPRPGTQADP
jgi:hypothetical protein